MPFTPNTANLPPHAEQPPAYPAAIAPITDTAAAITYNPPAPAFVPHILPFTTRNTVISPTQRLTNPDLAKILCALIVAINHCLVVTSPNPWVMATLGNGTYAVYVFFAFSGWFISAYLEKHGANPLRLLAWRGRRILPSHLMVLSAIAFTVLLVHLPPAPEWSSAWFKSWYTTPLTLPVLTDNLLLRSSSLNSVTWTLWYESVFLLWAVPLFWITKRIPWQGAIGIWLLLYGLDLFQARSFDFANMMYKFYPGVILFVHRDKLKPAWWQLTVFVPMLLTPFIHSTEEHIDPLHLLEIASALGAAAAVAFAMRMPQLRPNWLTAQAHLTYPFFLSHFFVVYLGVTFLQLHGLPLILSSIAVTYAVVRCADDVRGFLLR